MIAPRRRPQKALPSRTEMDWEAIVSLVSERMPAAMAVLDADGIIRSANAALERLVNRPSLQLVGLPWAAAVAPPDAAEATRRQLRAALRGTTTRCECLALTADGRRLALSLDLVSVPARRRRGLLVVVLEAYVAPSSDTGDLPGDFRYTISTSPEAFGQILSYSDTVTPSSRRVNGRPCFEVVYGRKAVCVGCPARDLAAGERPMDAILRGPRAGTYRLLSARRLSPTSALIVGREVSSGAICRIVDVRVEELVDAHCLSHREGVILRLLALGRELSVIATELGIAARTVKFHQKNVLGKLRVQSRLELHGLIFRAEASAPADS